MKKCLVSQCASVLVAVLILLAAGAAAAQAGPILDQSNVPDMPNVFAEFVSTDPNQQRAQTFTVGISGLLTQVNVLVERFFGSSGNLAMEIRQTTLQGGVYFPVSNGFLLQTSVPLGNVPPVPNPSNLLTAFDVSTFGLHVDAGDHLAIVLYGQGGSDYNLAWEGARNNPYPPGEAFERDLPNHDWRNESSFFDDYDNGFQTFVDPAPVPEPSTLILAVVGALGLLSFGRRRLQRSAAAALPVAS